MASLLLPDGGRKKAHHVGRFFQQHALGLTARLSDVINDLLNRNPPVQEKRRYIKAMEEMVRVCKSYVRIARPQVCSPCQPYYSPKFMSLTVTRSLPVSSPLWPTMNYEPRPSLAGMYCLLTWKTKT